MKIDNMKKGFSSIIFLFMCSVSDAQLKVANYATGKFGTKGYEHFSFWIKDRKASAITYNYGTKPKEISLESLSTHLLNGRKSLKVRFPNKHVLCITADKEQLLVTDSSGAYRKLFQWEYQGPVNGIGTFCDVCAEDENEAITIIEQYFLKQE